eukprot:TRINITY_DN1307_c0_g1_i19.p2 TRINITY_DN1307_c0_g1~~TRINITY_DN1307_c0_g1_i19.p2  ORF type:complete len:537 (-),score=44.31 TRINITY_DN1307_c0_g1_i19:1260-2870(-)
MPITPISSWPKLLGAAMKVGSLASVLLELLCMKDIIQTTFWRMISHWYSCRVIFLHHVLKKCVNGRWTGSRLTAPPSGPPPSPLPPSPPPPPSPSPPPPECYTDPNYIEEQCADSSYTNIAPECACDSSPTSTQPSIIGGVNVKSTDYPFIVSLQSQIGPNCYFSFCGGSLIAPNLVLTASHCVSSQDANNPNFFVAQAPRCRHEGGFARVRAARVIVHEGYNVGYQLANDIALVQLQSNLPGSTVDISASADLNLVTGTKLGMIGYGVSENPTVSGEYEKVALQGAFNIDYKANQDCSFGVEVDQICTESFPVVNNGCYGDSGGPLVYLQGTRPVQVGITSFVRVRDSLRSGCYQGNGGYARVSYFLSWITTNSGIDFGTSDPLPQAPAPPSPPPPPPVPATLSATDTEFLNAVNNFRTNRCNGIPNLTWNFELALQASVVVNRCVASNHVDYTSFLYFSTSLPASSTATEVFTAALNEANQGNIGQQYQVMVWGVQPSSFACALKTDCSQRFDEDFVHLVCIFDARTTQFYNSC